MTGIRKWARSDRIERAERLARDSSLRSDLRNAARHATAIVRASRTRGGLDLARGVRPGGSPTCRRSRPEPRPRPYAGGGEPQPQVAERADRAQRDARDGRPGSLREGGAGPAMRRAALRAVSAHPSSVSPVSPCGSRIRDGRADDPRPPTPRPDPGEPLPAPAPQPPRPDEGRPQPLDSVAASSLEGPARLPGRVGWARHDAGEPPGLPEEDVLSCAERAH